MALYAVNPAHGIAAALKGYKYFTYKTNSTFNKRYVIWNSSASNCVRQGKLSKSSTAVIVHMIANFKSLTM